MTLERIWRVLLNHGYNDPDLYEDLWGEIQQMIKEAYLSGEQSQLQSQPINTNDFEVPLDRPT